MFFFFLTILSIHLASTSYVVINFDIDLPNVRRRNNNYFVINLIITSIIVALASLTKADRSDRREINELQKITSPLIEVRDFRFIRLRSRTNDCNGICRAKSINRPSFIEIRARRDENDRLLCLGKRGEGGGGEKIKKY